MPRRRFRISRRSFRVTKTLLPLYIPEWLHRDYKKFCFIQDVSMTDDLRIYIQNQVEEYEKEHGPLYQEENATTPPEP
jgi:hypothetical protein